MGAGGWGCQGIAFGRESMDQMKPDGGTGFGVFLKQNKSMKRCTSDLSRKRKMWHVLRFANSVFRVWTIKDGCFRLVAGPNGNVPPNFIIDSNLLIFFYSTSRWAQRTQSAIHVANAFILVIVPVTWNYWVRTEAHVPRSLVFKLKREKCVKCERIYIRFQSCRRAALWSGMKQTIEHSQSCRLYQMFYEIL